jgi:serine/threonine protein kinase
VSDERYVRGVVAPAFRFVCPTCGQSYPTTGFCANDGIALVTTDDPLLGTEIGRYRLARLLGEGGMGRVYLAVQPQIGSRVAVKILSDQCARNQELLERFFAEARAVNLIRHEGIVNVIDMAMLPDGRPYIIMEFVEGGTLADALRAGPIPLGGLVQVATEMFSALAAAHAIGIVHRDLKPDNVLVTVEGHAKVLDFGIAKLAPNLQQGLSPRTQTGALLGTPQYMAPEQISGTGMIDARADIYSAGVLLFEAITGRRPFEGETLFDLMRMHLEQPPPSMRAIRPDLPIAMERVVMTAMAKRPDDRFQSVMDMSYALQEAAQQLAPEEWRPVSSITPHRHAAVLPRRGSSGAAPLMSRSGAGQRTAPPIDFANNATVPLTGPKQRGKRWPIIVATAFVAIGAALLIAFHGSGGDDFVVVKAPEPTPAPKRMPAAPPIVQTPTPDPTPAPITEPPQQRAPETTVAKAKPTDKLKADAAKHGVIIGDNVTIGPNVVIGGGDTKPEPPAPLKSSHPVDYDPKHFNANAYAATAFTLARSIYPDAGFVRMDMVNVYPDGHADLTLTDDDATYWFRSPSHSARPTDIPANLSVDIKCYVEVKVGPKSVEVRARTMNPIDESCKWPIRRFPSCALAKVWDQAKAAGAATNTIAKIGFLSDGKWFFDNEYEGKGVVSSFADHCP